MCKILALLALVQGAAGVQQSLGRRAVLGSAALACLGPSQRAFASTRDGLTAAGSEERCENGEGAACDRLAGGNDYVRMLQERSKTNKETNAAKVWDKTVMSMSYDEYFAAVDKNMVLLPNGKYALLSTEDYARRRKAGQIKVGAVDRLLVDLVAPAAEPAAEPAAAPL